MKTAVLAVAFAGLLLFGASNLGAQAYPYPYYYWDGFQYQQYWAQDSDPYYDLHVLHYQLYLPQYQYQPFPVYPPIYPSCCFVGGVVISRPSVPLRPLPHGRVVVPRRR